MGKNVSNGKLSFWKKLRAYRLDSKMVVCITLAIIVAISIVLYCIPWFQTNQIAENILLAVFTSLLVSILVMLTEIYVAFKDNERDQFLTDIHTFGIENLNSNKEEVLRDLLKECDSYIWISGYRLIMTNNLKKDLAEAIIRGAEGKAVLCAPWTEGFQLVYGKHEKVMNNYFEVFHQISLACKQANKQFNVLITSKPIFSDTYRVDQNLVTGPYMHNRDVSYNRLMAKDFFSYNLVKKSPLYDLIYTEFETLVDEAEAILDWEKFDEAYNKRQMQDLNESQQRELFKNCCIDLNRNID